MSADEIMKELPRLTETDRRQIRKVLLDLANGNPDVAQCNQSANEGALQLDQLEEQDAQHPSR